jgi:hypothetical protein
MSENNTNFLMIFLGLVMFFASIILLRVEFNSPVVGEHVFLLVTFGAGIIMGFICFVVGMYCYRNDM